MDKVKQWVEKHWWAVMLIGLAVIAGMIAFVKFCSVHTPSDNRRLPPARPLRGEAYRPVLQTQGPPQGRGNHHHGHNHHHHHHHHNRNNLSTVSERVSTQTGPPVETPVRPVSDTTGLRENGVVDSSRPVSEQAITAETEAL